MFEISFALSLTDSGYPRRNASSRRSAFARFTRYSASDIAPAIATAVAPSREKIFWTTLDPTKNPFDARLSAARTTPSLLRIPTVVVMSNLGKPMSVVEYVDSNRETLVTRDDVLSTHSSGRPHAEEDRIERSIGPDDPIEGAHGARRSPEGPGGRLHDAVGVRGGPPDAGHLRGRAPERVGRDAGAGRDVQIPVRPEGDPFAQIPIPTAPYPRVLCASVREHLQEEDVLVRAFRERVGPPDDVRRAVRCDRRVDCFLMGVPAPVTGPAEASVRGIPDDQDFFVERRYPAADRHDAAVRRRADAPEHRRVAPHEARRDERPVPDEVPVRGELREERPRARVEAVVAGQVDGPIRGDRDVLRDGPAGRLPRALPDGLAVRRELQEEGGRSEEGAEALRHAGDVDAPVGCNRDRVPALLALPAPRALPHEVAVRVELHEERAEAAEGARDVRGPVRRDRDGLRGLVPDRAPLLLPEEIALRAPAEEGHVALGIRRLPPDQECDGVHAAVRSDREAGRARVRRAPSPLEDERPPGRSSSDRPGGEESYDNRSHRDEDWFHDEPTPTGPTRPAS